MTKNIVEILDEFQKTRGIDNRAVVYDYTLEEREGKFYIDFYTSLSSIARDIERLFATTEVLATPRIDIRIHLLPDSSVGDRKFGICNIGTASLYRSAGFSGEQVSQLLLGESFDILQRKAAEWFRFGLHRDGYLGWIHETQIHGMSEPEYVRWKELRRGRFKAHISRIMEKPGDNSHPIRDTVIGVELPVTGEHRRWKRLLLPDGSSGWVRAAELGTGTRRRRKVLAAEIVKTAKQFLGCPYQWGGRSPKGFDCSGLIQTVFGLNRIDLPRDTSQQWNAGRDIGRDLNEIRKGDILFFGDDRSSVSHVGLCTGNKGTFIHARGFVRYNSLDPKSLLYNEQLASKFVGGRRIEGIG